jgi:hypothetical protein
MVRNPFIGWEAGRAGASLSPALPVGGTGPLETESSAEGILFVFYAKPKLKDCQAHIRVDLQICIARG